MSKDRVSGSLSLVAQFDDIIKCYSILSEGCEPEFKRFALSVEEVRLKWLGAENECQRLKAALDLANDEVSKLRKQLEAGRKIIDHEKKLRKTAERDLARTIKDLAAINNSVHNRKFSEDPRILDRLNTINESMSDVRSEMSYSRSDDDLEISYPNSTRWRKSKGSTCNNDEHVSAAKRKRSSLTSNTRKSIELNSENDRTDRLIATTTITMKKNGGPVSASSVIETIPAAVSQSSIYPIVPSAINIPASAPPKSDSESESVDLKFWNIENNQNISPNFAVYNNKIFSTNKHKFVHKTIVTKELCGACGKSIKFAKMAQKCKDCHAIAHYDCRDKLPLPCVPMGNTPTTKGNQRCTIRDFTPDVPPMVPAIVIHCINEIEQRGFTELGLYRVPGSDKDVKALKEKFMRGKGAPNLSHVADIHVVCGCLKDFLRNLNETLIPPSMWDDFVHATEIEMKYDQQNLDESRAILYQAVRNLPQPNRDTLAYLILHLQRVAEVPECKMSAKNLAKIFAPTLLAPKNPSTDGSAYQEVQLASKVVELLLSITSDYWATFISGNGLPTPNTYSSIQLHRNTPSTENLMRQAVNKLFSNTPLKQRSLRQKKRYFDTPPSCQKP